MSPRCKEPGGCKRKPVGRGYCGTHYQAHRRAGEFPPSDPKVVMHTHVPFEMAEWIRSEAKRFKRSVSAEIVELLAIARRET